MTNFYKTTIRSIIADLRAAHYPSDYLLVGLSLGRLERLAATDASGPTRRAIDKLQHAAVRLACKANCDLIELEADRAIRR